ncbi:response regulator [Actinospongicola halichondriae]|uniref:response regulator n=1 Tax=Actinospongicola halichondriae TaxID=3236844 RepID=UPI003D566315
MSNETTRILVVDDHPVFRMGMVALLGTIAGFEVVGEAETMTEAIRAATDTQPDVVLMDLQLGDGSGVEATRRILEQHPDIGVLVVTMMDDDDSVFAAIRAGARGYLLKGSGPEDIQRAVDAVRRGEVLLGPEVATRALGFLTNPRRSGPAPFPELTDREREILDLVAEGHDNASVARRLAVSPKTVRNHLSNVFTKLQVTDRAQAIVRAREGGLGRSTSG